MTMAYALSGATKRRRCSMLLARAKPTRRTSARNSPPECSASTCTTCASGSRGKVCDTYDQPRRTLHVDAGRDVERGIFPRRSEGHTSELQSLMRISYAVFCLKKKKNIVETQQKP